MSPDVRPQAPDLSHDILARRGSQIDRRINTSLAAVMLTNSLVATPVISPRQIEFSPAAPNGVVEESIGDYEPLGFESVTVFGTNLPQAKSIDIDLTPRLEERPIVIDSSKRAAAYDFNLDVIARESIESVEDPVLRQQKLEEQKRYVKTQVETLLGEKMHVLLRVTRYDLKDGKFYGEDMPGPAIESFKKGRDHRRLHGNSVDHKREDAEIDGISLIEERMAEAEVGDEEFFASPPGGTYPGNFYDIVTKRADERGEYVEFRRYSSALSYDEYRDFYREMGVETPDVPTDAFFLSTPIQIKDSRFQDADVLHAHLHRDHEYMEREEFQDIMRYSSGVLENYAANPTLFNLRAAINKADQVRKMRENGIEVIMNYSVVDLNREILALGSKKVDLENLPCGNLNLNDAEGPAETVSAFDRSYEFDAVGACVSCGREGMLGPCGLCEPCDAKARREQKKLK